MPKARSKQTARCYLLTGKLGPAGRACALFRTIPNRSCPRLQAALPGGTALAGPEGCSSPGLSTTTATTASAQIQLCWVAVLLVRVDENATGDTWRGLATSATGCTSSRSRPPMVASPYARRRPRASGRSWPPSNCSSRPRSSTTRCRWDRGLQLSKSVRTQPLLSASSGALKSTACCS